MQERIPYLSDSEDLVRPARLNARPAGPECAYSKTFSMFHPFSMFQQYHTDGLLENGFAKTHCFSILDPEHRACELADTLGILPADSTIRLDSYTADSSRSAFVAPKD